MGRSDHSSWNNSNPKYAPCDLGITAHSFNYIGKRTRYILRLGWLGYHPSLLPRHRGRSAIEWATRMHDAIIGGTIFWLNAGIDRGALFIKIGVLSRLNIFFNPKKVLPNFGVMNFFQWV